MCGLPQWFGSERIHLQCRILAESLGEGDPLEKGMVTHSSFLT